MGKMFAPKLSDAELQTRVKLAQETARTLFGPSILDGAAHLLPAFAIVADEGKFNLRGKLSDTGEPVDIAISLSSTDVCAVRDLSANKVTEVKPEVLATELSKLAGACKLNLSYIHTSSSSISFAASVQTADKRYGAFNARISFNALAELRSFTRNRPRFNNRDRAIQSVL